MSSWQILRIIPEFNHWLYLDILTSSKIFLELDHRSNSVLISSRYHLYHPIVLNSWKNQKSSCIPNIFILNMFLHKFEDVPVFFFNDIHEVFCRFHSRQTFFEFDYASQSFCDTLVMMIQFKLDSLFFIQLSLALKSICV